jgi:hypothetical protein
VTGLKNLILLHVVPERKQAELSHLIGAKGSSHSLKSEALSSLWIQTMVNYLSVFHVANCNSIRTMGVDSSLFYKLL